MYPEMLWHIHHNEQEVTLSVFLRQLLSTQEPTQVNKMITYAMLWSCYAMAYKWLGALLFPCSLDALGVDQPVAKSSERQGTWEICVFEMLYLFTELI